MAIQRQSGMSLIEMLVAAILLAGGIVGALALQTSANKTTFDAMQRSQAAALADDIIARIRANTQGEAPPTIEKVLNQYVNNQPGEIVQYRVGGDIAQDRPTNICNTNTPDATPCKPEEVAAVDLYLWQQKMTGQFADETNAENRSISSIGLTNPLGCLRIEQNMVEVAITWHGRTDTLDATLPANNNNEFDADHIRAKCRLSEDPKNRQLYVRTFIF
ncbi:type IV pilus modification PilV family protein [Algicola sagamiensis]|uniref:type IV pilus modification PilV family protein n=1 Tax=Algicola sagamiensis TaxID=163869 RepID=UPI00036ECEDE|nr:hypothetical protein [Algicola sagamiensis]